MKSALGVLLKLALAALISAPAAVFATLMLMPLWSAIEARGGIESVGHSGPASWCYGATFAVILTTALVFLLWPRQRDATTH